MAGGMVNTVNQGAGGDLRECDLIMRGGITSGVVYPGVLAGLAKHYRFRNIGGASAGAIAAGVAAAAEYGRSHPPSDRPDFDPFSSIVGALPDQIGGAQEGRGGTSMQRLFQAHGAMLGWADLLWSVLKSDGWSRKVRLISPVVWLVSQFVFAGALLAMLLLAACLLGLAALTGNTPLTALSAPDWPWIRTLGICGAVVLAFRSAIAVPGQWLSDFRDNGFGLATGTNPAIGPKSKQSEYLINGGFADWMFATLQSAAGRSTDCPPLVMGDLWGTDDPFAGDRAIDLLLTTTNLSQQLPHQFPFLERSRSFLYFNEADLRKVLPGKVVAFMVALQTGDPDNVTGGRAEKYARDFALVSNGVRYLRVPMIEDMPVLLGIRLSLSFPLLISAVKLYETIKWQPAQGVGSTRGDADRDYAARELKPCWFSDGGITSNFPVNSFDSPLPLRPTFCISLADLPPDADPDPAKFDRIHMNISNSAAIRGEHLVDIDSTGLPGFLDAIVSAARNAHENELVTMPGQRDRIVTIFLDPKSEGGLNLAMPAATIRRLAGFGALAAERLIGRFAAPPTPDGKRQVHGWENHRWVRMRASLAAVERFMVSVDRQWAKPQVHDGHSYQTLIKLPDARLPSYRWEDKALRLQAATMAEQVAKLAHTLTAAAPDRPTQSVFDGKMEKSPTSDRLERTGQAPRPIVRLALKPGGSDPRA